MRATRFLFYFSLLFDRVLLTREIELDLRAVKRKISIYLEISIETKAVDQILFLLFFGSVRKRHAANRDRSVSLALAARSTERKPAIFGDEVGRR